MLELLNQLDGFSSNDKIKVSFMKSPLLQGPNLQKWGT